MIVDPFRPKDTPLEFEKTTEPKALLVVPAEKFGEPPPALAVTVEPASPKVTLLLLEKTVAPGTV